MRSFFVFCIAAATLAAQDSSSSGSGNGGGGGTGSEAVTAAGQFFDHDFVNFFAFANGVLNTNIPAGENSSGQAIFGHAFGWESGGGVSLVHSLRDGTISLNYSGSYHEYGYPNSSASTGQQQSLSLAYSKRFNRHWSMSASLAGGILGFGSSFYSGTSLLSTTPGNPYSEQSRFANVGLNLTYAQTRRLSYIFSGSFFYNGYLTPASIALNPLSHPPNVRGVTGGASVLYRLTARTTVGGSYSHSYYYYSAKVGTTDVDSGSLTLSHQFQDHWQLDLSAGANHSSSSGVALTPISFQFGGVSYLAYCECPYTRKITSPAYSAVLTHYTRHTSVSLSGGQSVLAGNGIYLTSRDEFANAIFSYSLAHSNVSFGGNYSRLSSVSTADLAETYGYYGASASFGTRIVSHLSGNARWDLVHYDGLFTGIGVTENRFSFGVSLSTQSVPLTLF